MDRASVAILILALCICSSATQAQPVDGYALRDGYDVTRRPQQSSPQPSLSRSPLRASVPKPKQPNPPPPASSLPGHRHRPRTCLVETVLFDSCDPKYPEANKNATRTERGFAPQGMSSGVLKDSAGCCLGFAVFTNDCNPTIKDLSFAKQRFYSRLQDSCGQFQ